MSVGIRLAPIRGALLAYVLLGTGCTTLAVAPSRPPASRVPAPPPPVSAPQPSPAPVPPSLPPQRTPAPSSGAVVTPRPQSDASGASGALLEQSRAQRAAGSMPAAKASLERALRIDPNNAALWIELGEIELQTGNATQAATLARKALSLAGRNAGLTARAERLLRAAE